jgi:hypothetical protein
MTTRHLTPAQRIVCRDRVMQAAALALRHRGEVEYTMGNDRWNWKKAHGGHGLRARDGEFPRNLDCSSWATWCLWNGLWCSFGLPDVVNALAWRGGSTYTMDSHGRRVDLGEAIRGDCVFYNGPAHVAVYIGGGDVVSHGSDSGPNRLDARYRRVVQVRRYIL